MPLPEEAWLNENKEKSKDDEDEILALLKEENSQPSCSRTQLRQAETLLKCQMR